MTSNGGSLVNLTSDPAADAQPSWSPDGRIAFASDRGAGSTTGIYAMNADGSSPTEITDPPEEVSHRTPAWSPEGAKIAFVSNEDGDDDIYLVNPDGTGVQNISNTTGIDESAPAWSPGGQELAYVRIESGSPQSIWTMNRDGSGQSALTSDPAGADSPTWSTSGTKIAFARAGEIYAINVDGTGLTNLTNTPDWAEYDPVWQQLPPGPRRAGYARPKSASPTNIRLVPCLRAMLRRRTERTAGPSPFPSCSPPVLESDYLTTGGTPGLAANWTGLTHLQGVLHEWRTVPPCPEAGTRRTFS